MKALGHLCLGRVIAGHPEARALETVGKVLLLHIVALVVVGILVAFVISEVGHQLGGRVAQMQGNGQVAGLRHGLNGIVDGHVC